MLAASTITEEEKWTNDTMAPANKKAKKASAESARTAEPRRNWQQLAIAVLLIASNLFVGITFACIVPFFPIEAKVKGLSTSQVGLVIGIFQLCSFFISPVFGKYLVVLRVHRAFIGGLLFTSLCTIALGGTKAGLHGYVLGPPLGSALFEFGGFGLPLYSIGLSFVVVLIPSIILFSNRRRHYLGIESQSAVRSDAESGGEMPPRVLQLLAIPDLFLAITSMFLNSSCWYFYEPSLTTFMADVWPRKIGHNHSHSPNLNLGGNCLLEVAYGLGYLLGPLLGSVLFEIGGFGLLLYSIGLSFTVLIVPSIILLFFHQYLSIGMCLLATLFFVSNMALAFPLIRKRKCRPFGCRECRIITTIDT